MAADADFNAESLVEEGLKLYSKGELDTALARWRSVLEREPENHRAREYLRYVEDNRAALEESFRLARQSEPEQESRPAALVEPVRVLSAELPPGVASGGWAPASADQDAEIELDVDVDEAVIRKDDDTGQRLRAVRPAPHTLDTPPRRLMPPPPPENSREVLDIPPSLAGGRRGGLGELSRQGKPPSFEADPSFIRLADEIAEAAQRISEEIPIIPPLPSAESEVDAEEADDHTPRLDLSDLKARVADTKRRLQEGRLKDEPGRASASPVSTLPGIGRPMDGPMTTGPAEAPTSPILSSRLPIPRIEEGSVSTRPTPSSGSASLGPEPIIRGRSRRATPLTLIGGGGKRDQDFEPLEATPVAQGIPKPSRLVPAPEPRNAPAAPELVERVEGDGEAALQELARDTATPAKLSRTPKPVTVGDLAAKRPLFDDQPEHKKGTKIGLGPGQAAPRPVEAPAAEVVIERRSLTPPRDGVEKVESLLESARQLHEQGTFEGSLWLCERVLVMDAGCAEAQNLLRENQQILLGQYRSQLGDANAIPVVQIPQHEIMWHKLDHRAGFLLSRIDGQLSFEDLLDVSGMSEFEACRILSQLMSQGVIGPRR